MPTDKPRFSIVVTDELYEKINDFRFEKRIKSQSKAVNELIKIGLTSILNEDFEIEPNFSKQEINLVRKYNSLDAHGKKIIDLLLRAEYERCAATADPSDKRASEILEEINSKTRKA